MRQFLYDGKGWRSIRECCEAYGVSYQKARRLIRHYVRASRDPGLAIEWCRRGRVPAMEARTFKWDQDAERMLERKERFFGRVRAAVEGAARGGDGS